jgi:hypothetical protein
MKKILNALRIIALYAAYGVILSTLFLLSTVEKGLEALFTRIGEAIYAG